MIRIYSIIAATGLFIAFFAIAHAEGTRGPVLVTVGGNITAPNREKADDFSDAFFGTQQIGFEKAHEFDLASLEALGMKTITMGYEDWPKSFTFEGPLLADVLKAAGATGTTILPTAVDGYAPEIPMSDLEKYAVILALKKDGEYLGLGGHGPAWIIYPRDDHAELRELDLTNYVWAVYYIGVR